MVSLRLNLISIFNSNVNNNLIIQKFFKFLDV